MALLLFFPVLVILRCQNIMCKILPFFSYKYNPEQKPEFEGRENPLADTLNLLVL